MPTEAELQAEIDRLNGELTTAAGQLTTEKTRADGYQLELRTRDHKAAFGAKWVAAGGNAAAIDLVWGQEGYEPAADEVDAAAVDELVERCKAGHAYLFAPAKPPGQDPPAQDPAPTPKPRPPVGGGRGGNPTPPAKFRVTRAQTMDSKWKLTNQQKINEAIANGTIEWVGFGEAPAAS